MPLGLNWDDADEAVEFKLRCEEWMMAAADDDDDDDSGSGSDTEIDADPNNGMNPYVRRILMLHQRETPWQRRDQLTLREHGVCVIETGGELRADIERLSLEFLVAHTTMPELQRGWYERGETAHLGGSAFLGWPSTFHHPAMRQVRKIGARLTARRLLDEQLATPADYAHAIIDRTALRRGADAEHSQAVSSESFHQDVSPYRDSPRSIMLGGWIVLDPAPQKFRCVTGTAFTPTRQLLGAHERYMNARNRKFKRATGGFATFSVNAEERGALRAASTDIVIPPYSIILFDERIVHEVYGTRAAPSDVRRQFLGFQAKISVDSDSGGDTDDDVDDRLDDRGRSDASERPPDALIADHKAACRNLTVPLIKSGQRPRVMASAYQNFTRNVARLRQWSDDVVVPALKQRFDWKSGPNAGQFKYEGPPAIIRKSLREYAPDFPGYSEQEIAFLDKRRIADFVANAF